MPSAALLLAIAYFSYSGSGSGTARRGGSGPVATVTVGPTVRLNLPPPDLFRPITPEQALEENASGSSRAGLTLPPRLSRSKQTPSAATVRSNA